MITERTISREEIYKFTKAIVDKGLLIEAGWAGLQLHTLQGASEVQILEMRKAFFAGAQHLFASIMSILDSGSEATEKDLQRMTLIDAELSAWKKSFMEQDTQ